MLLCVKATFDVRRSKSTSNSPSCIQTCHEKRLVQLLVAFSSCLLRFYFRNRNNIVTPDPASIKISIKISIKTQDDRDCVKSAFGVFDAWKAWPDLHTGTFKCNRWSVIHRRSFWDTSAMHWWTSAKLWDASPSHQRKWGVGGRRVGGDLYKFLSWFMPVIFLYYFTCMFLSHVYVHFYCLLLFVQCTELDGILHYK